ncbi:hypothetical protein [Microcystis phage MJing1]|nr:hypothetical protein [Microcystis phage MJing1]
MRIRWPSVSFSATGQTGPKPEDLRRPRANRPETVISVQHNFYYGKHHG